MEIKRDTDRIHVRFYKDVAPPQENIMRTYTT